MEKFRQIFTGLMRAHGCTYVDKKGADGLKIKGKSFVKREPVTEKLWQNHLNGIEPSLGIIPINEDNECRWGCIDVDKYNLDHRKLLNKLPMGMPLWVCRSKSGGAHIFLFTTDFVPAKLMRDKLMSISAVLGYGGAEVFPKQIELKSQDDTGNFLNLPYFNYKNTTRYCFDSKGQAIKIDAFLNSVEVGALTPKELQDLKIERPPSEFDDGPPCLQSVTKEKLDDGRDRVMFQFKVYAKKKWPDNWVHKLDEFNFKHFANPFRHDEMAKFRKDKDKDYGYLCKDEPMCNHCDKQLCKTRKFGIGTQVLFPQLSDLQIIKLDPKIFRLNVDGERVELKAEELQEQRLFIRACMNQIHKYPPKLKPRDYDIMVTTLMANPELVEAPEGASKREQLLQHLENYCTSRTAEGATKEDMESGNVWNKSGHHHFIFGEFYHKFLHRHKWTEKYDITNFWLTEHCGCEVVRMNIGKKKISVIKLKEFEKEDMKIKERTFKREDAF
jgi:hypothetical protein